MAGTYTQIHLQFVFAVKKRLALLTDPWRDNLHKYITGIVQNKSHKMLGINSMPDHLHMLVGYRPHESISDFMKVVKKESTNWINEHDLCEIPFCWQGGYGAFSYAKSDIGNVIRYIQNQQLHHSKETFRSEYIHLLQEHEVEYDERYIFHEPE
jgi:REP element-mobilizing transposase RayT